MGCNIYGYLTVSPTRMVGIKMGREKENKLEIAMFFYSLSSCLVRGTLFSHGPTPLDADKDTGDCLKTLFSSSQSLLPKLPTLGLFEELCEIPYSALFYRIYNLGPPYGTYHFSQLCVTLYSLIASPPSYIHAQPGLYLTQKS